jgi:hypothetical protein
MNKEEEYHESLKDLDTLASAIYDRLRNVPG